LETHCKEQDISKYPVKFICIDDGGEKVRHVFAQGSFDAQEQFDTLIECKQCLAEKEETIQVIAETPPQGAHGKNKKPEKKEEEEEPDSVGGSPLKDLKDEVKALEGFMMNTSAELQKLNAKVYSKGFQPTIVAMPPPCVNCDTVGKKAGAKAVKKAASSLVHHQTHHQELRSQVVHPQVADPAGVQAQALRVRKEHRRQLDEDDTDEDKSSVKTLAAATQKAAAVASSLAVALKTAEERDDSAPAQQPAKAQMVLPKAAPKNKHLEVSLPKAHKDDDDGSDEGEDNAEDSSIPQSADEFEREEEAIDAKPSFSALQQHGDSDDGGEDDEESATAADDEESADEDASE
jgi:hypothetical protein